MTTPLTLTKTPAPAGFRGTPGRVLALVIGLPLILGAVGWSAFSFVGFLARTSEHHHASYAYAGGAVAVNVNSGDVQIRAADTRAVDVEYTEHYELKRPTVRGSSTAKGVTLTGHCDGSPLGQNCQINYVITVPKQAVLQVHIGDGRLTLQGVAASVTARVSDGYIHGSQLAAKSVQASVGDGNVNLQWDAAPSDVNASVGDGDVNVTVPPASGPYAIRTSGSGGSDIRVATDPAAKDLMVLHAGDGHLRASYGS
jgi:Putative adhesin